MCSTELRLTHVMSQIDSSNALPANPEEFRNISRRVLCFSKNFGLIFVRLSNVDYVPDILRRYRGPNKITINDAHSSPAPGPSTSEARRVGKCPARTLRFP